MAERIHFHVVRNSDGQITVTGSNGWPYTITSEATAVGPDLSVRKVEKGVVFQTTGLEKLVECPKDAVRVVSSSDFSGNPSRGLHRFGVRESVAPFLAGFARLGVTGSSLHFYSEKMRTDGVSISLRRVGIRSYFEHSLRFCRSSYGDGWAVYPPGRFNEGNLSTMVDNQGGKFWVLLSRCTGEVEVHCPNLSPRPLTLDNTELNGTWLLVAAFGELVFGNAELAVKMFNSDLPGVDEALRSRYHFEPLLEVERIQEPPQYWSLPLEVLLPIILLPSKLYRFMHESSDYYSLATSALRQRSLLLGSWRRK